MNWVKGFALVTFLAAPISMIAATTASAESAAAPDAKAATDTKADAKPEKGKLTKAQLDAILSKCSDEADAKGLFVKAGKGAARKAFRRECAIKKGAVPK